MKISVIGSGYVGLVTAVCFAKGGHDVLCLDVDKNKVSQLKKGNCPIFEPGLEELLRESILNKNISFTSDKKKSAEHGYFQFLCVGTPPSSDGSPNLDYLVQAAKDIAENIQSEKIIVNKSTVPVGTTDTVREIFSTVISKRKKDFQVDVASNPEFLREGFAINDFLDPDRVVIGSGEDITRKKIIELYTQLGISRNKVICMSEKSAELTKYAANAFLATKISFINEMANLSEILGANIKEVSLGIGSDERIGSRFLNAGCGFGGSCLPKDVDALISQAGNSSTGLKLLKEVKAINNNQKTIIFDKLLESFNGNVKGLKIAIWGLAFKPNTDDVRESPSIEIINNLISSGAEVYAHDPEAMTEFRKVISSPKLKFCDEIVETIHEANALVVITDWDIYKNYNFSSENVKMKDKKIFDGRLCMNREYLEGLGYEYISIGI